MGTEIEWYYGKYGKQEGPIPFDTLLSMYRAGQIRPEDLVWREGMSEWLPAGEVAELNPPAVVHVPTSPPPPVPPAAPSGGVPAPQAGVRPTIAPSGGPVSPMAHHPIPNYLVPSILVTIFCCVPFGIPAIVYAAKVDGLISRGDIAGAMEASNKAKLWTWISALSWIPLFGLFFLVGITSSM